MLDIPTQLQSENTPAVNWYFIGRHSYWEISYKFFNIILSSDLLLRTWLLQIDTKRSGFLSITCLKLYPSGCYK